MMMIVVERKIKKIMPNMMVFRNRKESKTINIKVNLYLTRKIRKQD